MNKKSYAILLIADISGYTQFIKKHSVSINHAKQIIVRLLKAIIKASQPPLKVAELEGDAVFFYAQCSENDIMKTAATVKKQLIQLFAAFKKELDFVRNMNVCNCDACMSAGDLKLKQVIHTGPIELETIHKIEKLFGLDVIVVHRMLKNSVPSKQYIMMSDQAYSGFVDFYGLQPDPHKEDFEGIGEVSTVVFYPDNILNATLNEDAKTTPSVLEKIGWMARLLPKTFLDLWGIKKIPGTFNNVPG